MKPSRIPKPNQNAIASPIHMKQDQQLSESTQQIKVYKEQIQSTNSLEGGSSQANKSKQQDASNSLTFNPDFEAQEATQSQYPKRLETLKSAPRPYPFKFSTSQELGGSGCCFKLGIVLFVIIYSAIFPLAYFYHSYINMSQDQLIYATYLYVLLFNGLILFIGGYALVGCIAYPYSNSVLQTQLNLQTNERFSTEFIKCTERIFHLIKDMTETQSSSNASAILLFQSKDGSDKQDLEASSKENSPIQLTVKEIYNRVAANIELINLYSGINEKVILENPNNTSRLFRTVTELLQEMKQTLDRIQIKIEFQHQWFPRGKFLSFWAYYNKVSSESENPLEQQNIRRFFSKQIIPLIPSSEANNNNVRKLEQLTEDLKAAIRQSIKRCCCVRNDEYLFGRLDQAKHILTETFEGRHFYVEGPTGNTIDCMFFPCTNKE